MKRRHRRFRIRHLLWLALVRPIATACSQDSRQIDAAKDTIIRQRGQPRLPREELPEYKGAPTHLARIRNTIHELSQESLEESINKLDIRDPYSLSFGVGIPQGPEFRSFISLGYVLASRRTQKLIEDIERQPKEQIPIIYDRIFEKLMVERERTFDAALLSWEGKTSPKKRKSLSGNLGGLCTAIFLTAHLSEAPSVCKQLERLEEFAARINGRMKQSVAFPPLAKVVVNRYLKPDESFAVSVLVHAVRRDASFDETLKKRLATSLKDVSKTTIEVVPWDAETTAYDFTVFFGDFDKSKGVMEVDYYDFKDPFREHQVEIDEVIDNAKKLIAENAAYHNGK